MVQIWQWDGFSGIGLSSYPIWNLNKQIKDEFKITFKKIKKKLSSLIPSRFNDI